VSRKAEIFTGITEIYRENRAWPGDTFSNPLDLFKPAAAGFVIGFPYRV
jgi:hypothetical protein